MSRALQVAVFLLLLALLAGVVFVVLTLASLINVPNQVAGGLGGLTSRANRALTSAQQAVQNVTDPDHPPSGLTQDTEFAALEIIHVGEHVPGGTQYVLSVQSIARRPGAEIPDAARYAVIHAELRQPRETRLLGQLIRTDADGHDYVIYKGESFRASGAMYRVNWISDAEHALAIAVYRNPDAVTAPLKFDYE